MDKPRCKLVGEDGNIFNLVGLARRALLKAGQPEKAKEMAEKVMKCDNYDAALATITEYVDAY